MASLNLDALKKKAPESSENIIQDTATAIITETPTSSWMPKISLMKLKEFSSHEQVESIPTPTQAPEEVTNIVEEAESISQEIPTSEVSTSLIIEGNDTTEVDSGESIFSMEVQEEAKEEATTQEPEIKVEEAKEFFPSLNLMEDFSISDDLLGIEDMSVKTETVTPIIMEEVIVQKEEIAETPSVITEESQVVIETASIEEVVQEIGVVTEEQEMVETKDVKEEISSLSMPTTYVQEVKNELSEQRKWGFRFFAKKKASVLAWIGIITTFSLIGLFSAGFFSTAVPSGKSNIQEAVQPIVSEEVTQSTPEVTPEVIETIPEAAPTTTVPTQEVVESTPETIETTPVVTQSTPEVTEVAPVATQPTPEMTEPIPTPTVYEAGRDYTVIKNTKKNLKKQ